MAERPSHVLWLTTDHMRYDCVAAYGNGVMHTPNLDYLAGNGVNFHQCYTQNWCCMPSRASYMTGLYPQQCGVTENGFCLPPDCELTAPRQFRGGGYHTGHIGKLHLQPHDGHAYEERPRHTYGFDAFYCAEGPGSRDDPYTAGLRRDYPEAEARFLAAAKTGAVAPWYGTVDAPWEASHSGWIARTFEEYMSCRGFNRQFLHLGFFAPHPPLFPTRDAFAHYDGVELPAPQRIEGEWADKPEPMRTAVFPKMHSGWTEERFTEYRRHFYALVTEVDLAIGRILDVLRKRGELEDTLIVFTSDHGDLCGDHGGTLKAPHFFDEVMHVPCLLHWPAGLGTERRDLHGLIEMTDVLPTMLNLCGIAGHERMRGISMADELRHDRDPAGREDVFAYGEPGYAMLRSKDWKYIRYSANEEVLFDLRGDPRETRNLAGMPGASEVLTWSRHRMLTRALDASRSPLRRLACW